MEMSGLSFLQSLVVVCISLCVIVMLCCFVVVML